MNLSKLKTADTPFADIIMFPPASKSRGSQNKENATTDDGGEEWAQRSGISAAQSWGQDFRFQHPHNKPGIQCMPVTPALGEGVRGRRSWDVFVSSLAKKMWTLGETVPQRHQWGETEEISQCCLLYMYTAAHTHTCIHSHIHIYILNILCFLKGAGISLTHCSHINLQQVKAVCVLLQSQT